MKITICENIPARCHQGLPPHAARQFWVLAGGL